MKIDVWADFFCPYCYVSIRTLDDALKETGKKVDYVHHGYLLSPDLVPKEGQSHFNWLSEHLDMDEEEAKKSVQEGIAQKAKKNDLPFHPEKARPANTKDAHLLAYYAMDKGLAQETVTRLGRAYYELGEDLNDEGTLRRIAEEVGLGENALDEAKNSLYLQKLEDDRKKFKELGIESVPHYVINDEIVLPGSKDREEFVEILNKYA